MGLIQHRSSRVDKIACAGYAIGAEAGQVTGKVAHRSQEQKWRGMFVCYVIVDQHQTPVDLALLRCCGRLSVDYHIYAQPKSGEDKHREREIEEAERFRIRLRE